MQARTDARAARELTIRVFGMDSEGRPVSQTAWTVDVSRRGARLRGVSAWNTPGEIIGIRCGAEKARFRIAWIGQRGTARDGQIGVTCIDPGKDIWGSAAPEPRRNVARAATMPETSERPPIGLSPHISARSNRRRQAHYLVTGHAKIQEPGAPAAQWATLHDLSAGGCYVETTTPLPPGSRVEISLHAGETQINARGLIIVKHPLVGMGMEFTELSPLDRQLLERLMADLAASGAREA